MNAPINTTLTTPDNIKNFQADILCIRNLCISSQAFILNQKFERSDEKLSKAKHLTTMLGYDFVTYLDVDFSFPEELNHFNTHLLKYWNEGKERAFLSAELLDCQYCQDKLIDMCPHHDF